jgi:ATP-dependent exoDNAse (exonuclease V) beta subunit
VLALLGSHIQVEEHTSQGRMDAVLQSEKNIYILEFKLGKASEAIAQIKNKDYAKKYQSLKKSIALIGIGFDPSQKNIADWLLEPKKG